MRVFYKYYPELDLKLAILQIQQFFRKNREEERENVNNAIKNNRNN